MQRKKIAFVLAAIICASSLLTGCSEKEDSAANSEQTTEDAENVSDHEPISILSSHKNMSAFMELVHEKYPEVNLEIIPYSGGRNLTDTGILGLEAMEEYFGQFETFSAKDIVWEN